MARRRRRSSRRRNPLSIRRALSNPIAVAKPALIGAAGALAVNGIVNYVPGIPDTLKTGKTLYLTKAAIALVIATLGRRVLGANAVKMGEGALTVIATDLGKELAMGQGVNLSGVGFVSPAMVMNRAGQPRLAAVRGTGMYVNGVRGMRGAGMYVRGRQ